MSMSLCSSTNVRLMAMAFVLGIEESGGIRLMVRPENPELFIQSVEMVRLRLDGADAPAAAAKSSLESQSLYSATCGSRADGRAADIFGGYLSWAHRGAPLRKRSQFVVRGPSTGTDSQLTNMVQGHSDILRSGDDSYVVIAYMLSRDAMRQLISDDGLLDVFNRSRSRFSLAISTLALGRQRGAPLQALSQIRFSRL